MKIAVRGGHNFSVPGASGIISETKEDRYVKDSLIKYLKAGGHSVLDVTAPDSCNTINSDLAYGVRKANEWGADLFISCHFNNCYNHYDGAIGTEVWVYNEFDEAKKALAGLASIGFINRGIKRSTGLYELRATNMKSMILEICFVEATKDVELYRAVGPDAIAKAVAEKICGKSLSGGSSSNNGSGSKPEPALWEVSISGQIVKDLQYQLNKQTNAGLVVDGWFGDSTLRKCILVRRGAHGEITRIIQKRLIAKGYSVGKYGADADFGGGTYDAVVKFQRAHGLSADGIVGHDTWKALFRK